MRFWKEQKYCCFSCLQECLIEEAADVFLENWSHGFVILSLPSKCNVVFNRRYVSGLFKDLDRVYALSKESKYTQKS
jgi:hypothetical protein